MYHSLFNYVYTEIIKGIINKVQRLLNQVFEYLITKQKINTTFHFKETVKTNLLIYRIFDSNPKKT